MELLVYARNYRALGSGPDAPSHRDLGAVVGTTAPAFSWGERLCSFIEVRLPVAVFDPSTEIELLIAKAFAVWGHPGAGRVLRFTNARGQIALLLEPGFERSRDLCQALRPVLPQARMMLETAAASSWPRPVPAAADVTERIELPRLGIGRSPLRGTTMVDYPPMVRG